MKKLALVFSLLLLTYPALAAFVIFQTLSGAGGGGSVPTITAGQLPGSATGSWLNWAAMAYPGQQGSAGLGFYNDVIANWDMPMYSMQTGTFQICVIGYQVSGTLAAPLAKVAFFLDNGTEVDVTSPNVTKTFSVGSGLSASEYCVQALDTALNDGPHELRAIAYPVRGWPREMASVLPATVTNGSAVVTLPAHSLIPKKVVTISGSGDSNFTNGDYCVDTTGTGYTLDGATGGSFELVRYTGGTCQATIITGSGSNSFTVTTKNAGEYNTGFGINQGESLFFWTNGNGHISLINGYADINSGNDSNGCVASGSPCQHPSNAIAKMHPASDGLGYAISDGTTFTNASNSFVNGQAVYLTSALAPLIANRTYWVVGAVANTSLKLANEPNGAAITGIASSGGIAINTDHSNQNLYLMCSGACPGSPANYAMPTQSNIVSMGGWFSILPNPGTSHANTVVNSVPAQGANFNADKLHIGVDINNTGCAYNTQPYLSFTVNDYWLDTLTYTGCSTANGNAYIAGIGNYEAVTHVSVSEVRSGPIYGQYFVDNYMHHMGGACLTATVGLNLGNNCTELQYNCCWMLPLSVTWASFTANFGSTALPPDLVSDMLYLGASAQWGIYGQFTAGNVSSNCATGNQGGGANIDAAAEWVITSIGSSPSTITTGSGINGPSSVNCPAGYQVFVSPEVHGDYLAVISLGFGYNSWVNSVNAFDVCTNHCAGQGIATEYNGPFYDIAFIGMQVGTYISVPTDTGTAAFTMNPNVGWPINGLLIADSNFSVGAEGNNGSGTYNYDDFRGNICNSAFSTPGTGFTVTTDANWGGGSGC